MVHRFIVLIVIVIIFAGFSWGSSRSSESEEASSSGRDRYAAGLEDPASEADPIPEAAVPRDIQSAQSVLAKLTAGTPEESKARIESLKRLSAALEEINRRRRRAKRLAAT